MFAFTAITRWRRRSRRALELSKGLGGAKSKPLKGAVRAANKKIPNRIKNDQQDIERFALNKYPKLKLALTTNLKTTGFKTGKREDGREEKVLLNKRVIMFRCRMSRVPPTRKRMNYKKRVILLDEIVNDDDDDVAEAAATLHQQQQGRNLNQNTNSLPSSD